MTRLAHDVARLRQVLARQNGPTLVAEVVADPEARYYGALLEERTLLPGADALTLDPRFEDWLVQTPPPK